MKGKIALVTGSSRGIGKQIALTLASRGATVIVNYNSNERQAQGVVSEIQKKGGSAYAIKANVSVSEDVEKLVSEIKKRFGALDYLVNNAGIKRDRSLKKMSEREWHDVIDVNLNALYTVTHKALSIFNEGGAIVNISSVIGHYGNFGQTNYAAAKAGIFGFTKSLSKELASKGIRVNAVAPGYIETDMTKDASFFKKVIVKKLISLNRLGTTEDISEAVAFLLSDDSSYMTGQVLNVNGGLAF